MNMATTIPTRASAGCVRLVGVWLSLALTSPLMVHVGAFAQSIPPVPPGPTATFAVLSGGIHSSNILWRVGTPATLQPTQIHYNVGKSGMVSLKVYNLLGNAVATLVDSRQAPGRYTVPFDADSEEHSLASGVYFFRLETGSVVSVRKLVVIR